jgi:DNA-binding transcriptional LysR family regulator
MPKTPSADALASHIHSRTLRYFDAIRRYRSIREAARQLHVASSAVNRQLLKLEAEIGTPLFERLPSGLSLTAAGEAFARHVITVLQDARRFDSEMDSLRGIRRGEISIVTVEGLNTSLLPLVIESMLTRYPAIRFKVNTAGSAAIQRMVVDGDADLGIAFSLPHTELLQQLAVGRFQLGAIMAPEHPLAGEASVTFAQCARYPLLLGNARLSIGGLLEPLIRRYAKPLQNVLESDSIELMRRLAARNHGIGFQTRLGLERDLVDGALAYVPLRTPRALVSELGVYARAGRTMTPALDAFVRMLAEAIAGREHDDPQV